MYNLENCFYSKNYVSCLSDVTSLYSTVVELSSHNTKAEGWNLAAPALGENGKKVVRLLNRGSNKQLINLFAKLSVQPSILTTWIACSLERWLKKD